MAKVIKVPMVSYVIELECDCGGKLEWDGIALATNPYRYAHACASCGKRETLTTRTGHLVHERASTGNTNFGETDGK